MAETDADAAEPEAMPDPVLRPRLALYLWERDCDFRKAGKLFNCSHTQVQIICLPFDDPRRRRPKDDLLTTIVEVTGGEIGSPDFDPPHLRGRWVLPNAAPVPLRAGDPVVLAAGRAG